MSAVIGDGAEGADAEGEGIGISSEGPLIVGRWSHHVNQRDAAENEGSACLPGPSLAALARSDK